ncbi:MAG TPA: tetratricopeptide repeat protein [Pirellulales bacterium]
MPTTADVRARGAARPWYLDLVAGMFLCGAVALIYGHAVHAPFIFDDRISIVENPSIRTIWPLLGTDKRPGPLQAPLDVSTAGRPLVNFSLAVNYQIGRLDPTSYHAFNALAHGVATLLMWLIVRRTLCLPFFGDRFLNAANRLAFTAALLWAVHPLQTETVEYVTQRTELLMALFYLGTLYAAQRYWAATGHAQGYWLVAAWGAALAGMACKEVMVTVPVVVLLFERTFLRGSFRAAIDQSLPLYLGLCASWALLIALNYGGARSASAGFHLGVSAYDWWLVQSRVLFLYLWLTIWPWPMVIHYEFPYFESIASAWMCVVPVLLLAVATIWLVYRRTATGFVWAAAFIVLSPTFTVPIITEIAAERRMYLPLAALLPWIIGGGYTLVDRMMNRLRNTDQTSHTSHLPLVLTIAITLGMAAVCGWLSFERTGIYNDPIALWEDAALYQPDNSRVQNNLGVELVDSRRPAEALPHYERALELQPDYVEARSNLGVALVHLQEFARARPEFEQALAINPHYVDAHINLAHLLVEAGRLEEAVEQYRAALTQRPNAAELHSNLGHVLGLLGDGQQSVAEFEEAVRLKPDFAEAHLNLGASLANTKPQEAVAHYEAALRANPDFVEAHSNLGALLNALGRNEEAVEHFREALRLRPDYAEAHSNLGIALVTAGNIKEGIEQFDQAVKLKPDIAGYANLAMRYAQAGRTDEAIATAEIALDIARTQGQQKMAAPIEELLRKLRQMR